jgi:hypothetical protein
MAMDLKKGSKSPSFGGDVRPHNNRIGQLQQFDPSQMKLYDFLFQFLGKNSDLSRMAAGDQSYYDEMEAPAMRQFSELLGGLSNRFATGSGRNSLGNLRSSGFQNAGTAASSNFAQDLASKRQGLQRQAVEDLMGYSNMLFGQRPTERAFFEKGGHQPSTSSQFGMAALGGAAKAGAAYAGGM